MVLDSEKYGRNYRQELAESPSENFGIGSKQSRCGSFIIRPVSILVAILAGILEYCSAILGAQLIGMHQNSGR